MVTWEWHAESDQVTGSPTREALYGLPIGTLATRTAMLEVVHLEDRERVKETIANALSGPPGEDGFSALEYRVIGTDGRIRWMQCQGRVTERDPLTGSALHAAGITFDITQRRESEAKLRASETRLATALRAARFGVWERDLTRQSGAWDLRAQQIYGGLTPEQAGPDLSVWRDRVHPDDRAHRFAAIERAVSTGGPDDYNIEFRFQHPNGSYVWIAVHGAVVERDLATGRALWLAGVVEDISERKRLEERQELLVREVDHRAKNALAVVQAALRLTPRSDAATYAAAVEGRVAALARAHSLLADGQWRGAELRTLIEGEVAPFVPALNASAVTKCDSLLSRVDLSGPTLWLKPQASQAISMAIHELATNASKHGALSVEHGQISVSWMLAPERNILRLRWQEGGGPLIQCEPERSGFGMRVLNGVLVKQLGGTLSHSWRREGLVVEVGLPLALIRTD